MLRIGPRDGITQASATVACVLLMLVASGAWAQAKIDLNRATLDEIKSLPIPPEVAEAIYQHREFVDYFESIYDLNAVEGMTPEILQTLMSLTMTMPPPPKSDEMQRYDAGFRQAQRFLSQEGANEEMAEVLLDILRSPYNINALDLFELQTFPNVSPVDAVAIVKARESAGRIENQRQLRSTDGLRYWGYRNLRDYVVYEDPREKWAFHGNVQLIAFNTPYFVDRAEILLEPMDASRDFVTSTGWGIRGLDSANPAVLGKVRLELGRQFDAGIMSFRNVGEKNLAETWKWFFQWNNPRNGRYQVDRAVAGHFRLAFGQGLVMDNTDFVLARKTGYGFNKRPRFILGDLSRTHEFALRGVAVEGRLGRFRGIGFFSRDKKDAVVNPDGSLNKYILMYPRFEPEELAAMPTLSGDPMPIKRDAMQETMFGGLAQVEIVPGTYVGVSGWEAQYGGKRWDPRVETIIAPENLDLLEGRDSPLFTAYDSRQLGDFRRVFGAEFQTVYKNVAFQGEYGKLDSNPKGGVEGVFRNAPDAYLVNAYVQYDDLNILALWRDIDVGYDNPYMRGFGQSGRYLQTLAGDPFRNDNPLLSWLATRSGPPQNASERGLFISGRYRVSRTFTISGFEFDSWKRGSDGQDLRRYVLRLEYAPIFPLRFRLRQRVSSRADDLVTDVRGFSGWDTRLQVITRLSAFDELRFLYSVTQTRFSTRPRLSGAAEAGDETPIGQAASPSQAIQAMLTHNFNENLKFVVSAELYDGFLWNFEDNEFIVLDDVGMRNWFLIQSRMGNNLMMRFKLTSDRNLTRRNIDIREFNDPVGLDPDGDDARRQSTAFRLQVDYIF
jgi:DNA uptake protein ComE-like DNA-binding protein